MEILLTEQTAPPSWSAAFNEYFATLKAWLMGSAYPALSNGPLKMEGAVTSIPTEVASIEGEIRLHRPIPVALVGRTGVGKSTLLNALLEEEFLPVGVIGSQTAAFVTILYAPQWEVTCQYIDESELDRIFDEARTQTDETTEVGSPEIRERAERKMRALFSLKADDPVPPELLAEGPPADLREIVRQRQRRFGISDGWKEELNLHGRGKYWPVTKSIDVRGPFPMLQSGVVISDLPGTGDLNWARANQASQAVKEAGQILIAVDGRLFQKDLMEQLEVSGRLPHRLFRDAEQLQIVVLGASLDKGLPDPEEEAGQVADLGLNPATATKKDVFAAVCARWRETVRPEFVLWLRAKASEFLPDLSDEERAQRVEGIMSNVEVIPTSARDWRKLRRGKDMEYCRDADDTGLPQLRRIINDLAEHQIKTTVGVLECRIDALRDSALAAIERSEAALGADIELILHAVQQSHEAMKEVQERRAQIVENLRLTVLDRFQQIRESLADKIQNAALKMGDLGRRRVQDHLDGVHWASLRATVLREGIWETGSGRQINLRDAMGGEVTRLVPQAWSRIAEQRLSKQIEETKRGILTTLDDFARDLLIIVSDELARESDKRTVQRLFDAGRERAEVKIERSASKVVDLLERTSNDMQERIDEAVFLSLQGVCDACCDDSNTGWKQRSILRIIDGTSEVSREAERRCLAIADEACCALEAAIGGFCKAAVGEMEKIGEDIPRVLKDAIEPRLTSPQEQKVRFETARQNAPPPRDA
jgi:hypothetical protein